MGQGGFNGNSIPERGNGICRGGRREGACLMLEAKRVVKLLSCNVGGGSGMT